MLKCLIQLINSGSGSQPNSYYYVDEVSITPINFASEDVSVCPGGCTQLDADIGNFNISYQWSSNPTGFSSTSSTPTVCPTVTTTYTVTATDANGGTATDAVVVSVFPPPPKPIFSGYFNTCHGPTTYTITNYNSSFSYYFNINTGGTQIPISSNQFSVNWNNHPNGGVLYVTVTDNNGCTATDSLKVFECCFVISGGNLLTNKNDETWTTAPTEQAFVVNGILTINGNITLNNKEVYFGPNAKIVINPNHSLTITNSSLEAGCRIMWDGIYINQSNSTLLVNNNSSISHAKNAIVSNSCGVFHLSDNTTLSANYRNIIVQTCASAFTGTISKTTINGTSSLMEQYPPITATRTYSGIEINNVGSITVGDATSLANRNYFNNMDFGIKNYLSNLEVYNNTFQNMTTYWIINPPTEGVAIISTASKFNHRNLTIGGTGTDTVNTNFFGSCFWGVYADYYQDVTIQRNNFSNINWISVYLYTHPTKNIRILSNKITNSFVGIQNAHCHNSNIDINSNNINNTNYGIRAENVNLSSVQKLNIYDNRIWLNPYGVGIWATNILGNQSVQLMVSHNYVYMNNPNLSLSSNGILVENSPYATIQRNTVSRSSGTINDPTQALNFNGIHVQLSPNSDICQNTLSRMGCGLRFGGSMPNTSLKLNNMLTHYFYGIRLDNANIGTQGTSAQAWRNRWVATNPNNRVQGTASTTTNWFYDGAFGQSNQYCPVPNSVNPPIYFQLFQSTGIISSCLKTVPLSLPAHYDAIVNNTYNYNVYPDENRYWDKMHYYYDVQYNMLQTSSISLSSQQQSFFDALANDNIGSFEKVNAMIQDGDLLQAESLNAAINPVNDIEKNRLIVNQIYIDTWAQGRFEFTADEQSTLESIALLEPLTGGDAVYSARVLLGINPGLNQTSNRMAQSTQTQQSVAGKIYPNPAKETAYMDIVLNEGETAYLTLFDMMGTTVRTYAITDGESRFEFSTNELKAGLYFYRLLLDNKHLLESGKLIIIN